MRPTYFHYKLVMFDCVEIVCVCCPIPNALVPFGALSILIFANNLKMPNTTKCIKGLKKWLPITSASLVKTVKKPCQV